MVDFFPDFQMLKWLSLPCAQTEACTKARAGSAGLVVVQPMPPAHSVRTCGGLGRLRRQVNIVTLMSIVDVRPRMTPENVNRRLSSARLCIPHRPSTPTGEIPSHPNVLDALLTS
jgi:hypothetical protein